MGKFDNEEGQEDLVDKNIKDEALGFFEKERGAPRSRGLSSSSADSIPPTTANPILNHITNSLTSVLADTSPSGRLVNAIVQLSHDAKALEIVVLDVSRFFAFADYFVVVSGRSDRQVQGICNRVLQGLAKEKIRPLSVEGLDQGHWVLIDLEDVILHVFYEPLRDHYNLEGLWSDARRFDADPETGQLVARRKAA